MVWSPGDASRAAAIGDDHFELQTQFPLELQ
jgi:hypothetical protein